MLGVNDLEIRRLKIIMIQRNRQILYSIMFSTKNYSIVPEKFSCFTLDPRKWKKKISGLFYWKKGFHIIFWKKTQRKFSGFLTQSFKENQDSKISSKILEKTLRKLTPLFSEADLSIFDGFIQFQNKCLQTLPIQVVQENLWASFSNFSNFSAEIEEQIKFISISLRKIFSGFQKILIELPFSKKPTPPDFQEFVKIFFLDLIFRSKF